MLKRYTTDPVVSVIALWKLVYTDDNRLPCMVQVWGCIESLPVRKGRGNLCTAI